MLDWIFGHPCCICGDRHTHNKETMGTMGGDIHWWYCEKHWEMKEKQDKEKAEQREIQYKKHQDEEARRRRIEWLEKEIHYREVEQKAKELGIEYDGQV